MKKILLVLSVILTILDIGSDVVLAVDYCVTGNPWWCGLTWTFLAVPELFGFIFLYVCVYGLGDDRDESENTKSFWWKLWKGFEICFESGPQLILQLYIIASTEKDPSSTSGDTIILKFKSSFVYFLEKFTIGEKINRTCIILVFFICVGRSTFMMILQVGAVIMSLLSLSFGFVSRRQFVEEDHKNEKWNWKHMVIDMVWNVLSISPRVIAFAFFASFELSWFWGIVGFQIVIAVVISFWYNRFNGDTDLLTIILRSIYEGVGLQFTMCTIFQIRFWFYLFYWLFTLIEITVLISLWYVWSSDLGLWYRDVTIGCVISGYFLSLLVKTLHTSYWNVGWKNILSWRYYSYKD